MKNLDVVIAFPLLNQFSSKKQKIEKKKPPLALLGFFYCMDDLRVDIIRLSF
jgi:hypothetical protein